MTIPPCGHSECAELTACCKTHIYSTFSTPNGQSPFRDAVATSGPIVYKVPDKNTFATDCVLIYRSDLYPYVRKRPRRYPANGNPRPWERKKKW